MNKDLKNKNLLVCECIPLDTSQRCSEGADGEEAENTAGKMCQDENGRYSLTVALAGEWKSRSMKVTDQRLAEMLTNYQMEARPLLFDIDHNSIFSFDSRAAGWGTGMRLEDGKLIVDMEPTPVGRALIESGEYRYLSPVYEYERDDRVTGKILKDWRLHSVALTNVPFLHELPAIKNSEMEGEEGMNELLKRLGAEDEAGALARLDEIEAEKDANAAKVAELTAQINASEVDTAIANGTLLPAQKELALKLINQDRGLYEALCATSAKPDLDNPVEVPTAEGDGLDEFQNVKSFGDLLANAALSAKMAAEQPARHKALYDRWMREGK